VTGQSKSAKKEELTQEEKTLLDTIKENPGRSILELIDISPFEFNELVQLLKSLQNKGRIYSVLEETEEGEEAQWHIKKGGNQTMYKGDNEKKDEMFKALLDSTTIGILGKIVESHGCTKEELTQVIITELEETGFIEVINGTVEITEKGKEVLTSNP
jgi:predicted transcriptional regulator